MMAATRHAGAPDDVVMRDGRAAPALYRPETTMASVRYIGSMRFWSAPTSAKTNGAAHAVKSSAPDNVCTQREIK